MSACALFFPALLCNSGFSLSRQGQKGQKAEGPAWPTVGIRSTQDIMIYFAVSR